MIILVGSVRGDTNGLHNDIAQLCLWRLRDL